MNGEVKISKGFLDEKEMSHPSFAQISLSKLTCGGAGQALYGSSIRHSDVISLKIEGSTQQRRYHEDKFSSVGQPRYIEVLLSPIQFSEMLTTMNYGQGVPCTLVHKEGVSYSFPDEVTEGKVEEFKEESKHIIQELKSQMNPHIEKIQDKLASKKTLGKGDQEELLRMLKDLSGRLDSNTDLISEQFSKFADKTIVEAKATIDSHVDTVIRQTGLEALRNNSGNNLLGKKEE